jgi:peptide deformylase
LTTAELPGKRSSMELRNHRHVDPDLLRPRLSLRIYPDEVLRKRADPVTVFDSRLSDVLEEMVLLMRTNHGIGLAATQVGLLERFFIFEYHADAKCLANPRIRRSYGNGKLVEGCLSLPEVQVRVSRPQWIEVVAYDPRGRRVRLEVQGILAHVVQHEIDHLNGVLIVDHGDPLKGDRDGSP